MEGIIYKISSPSGKVYVGQTIQKFNDRIRSHQRKGSECTAISRAIQKYGDEMKYEIIEQDTPQEQLDEREIYWIKELNSLAPGGYNLTTGGQFNQVTQEVKDKMRDTRNAQKMEKDGYLGGISKLCNLFYPRVKRHGKMISISYGGFKTEEEAIEVLKEYTKDPENFTIVNNRTRGRDGSITKTGNDWRVSYKSIYLGTHETKDKAQEALEKYINNPENIPSFERKVGCIRLENNRWRLSYKRDNNLGNYDTKEQAQEALERYLKDPENFTKPEKKVGCVYKKCNRWVVICKCNRLGSYETEEEAQEVLKEYVKSPQSSR
tara:strand:- start:32 stop:994 length:963 start_codon:yes stop_codon:yes gene_type:complete